MVFKWREGARFNGADVQKVGERIASIAEKNAGIVTAEAVVRDARSDRSPLHRHFEWNDATAAHQYRLTQGRELIRAVVTIVEESSDKEPVRAFVNLGPSESYRPLAVVMANPDMREQLLRQAQAELQGFKKRFAQLSELAEVFAAIDRIAM